MPVPLPARPVATPARVLLQQARPIPDRAWRRALTRPQDTRPARPIARRAGTRLPESAVASYHEPDVRFAWNAAPGLEASVTGRNLLYSEHPGFGPAATRRQVGRSVLSKLSWRY